MKIVKKDDKKIKLLILILILLVLVFIIKFAISYIENYDEAKKEQENYGYETMPVYQTTEENYVPEKTIKYSNIRVLKDLKGELPSSTVITKVRTVFVEEIPPVIKEVGTYSSAKLKSYYAENKNDIRENLRIDNEESFLNMVEKFSKITCDLQKDFAACEFTNDENLGLKFSYENGEVIECKIVGENSNTITFDF